MNIGLAGTGNSGDWVVDIDEINDAHGLSLKNPQCYLQLRPISLVEIEGLAGFINRPKQNDSSTHVTKCFCGKLGISFHDGRTSLRITQTEGEYGTNLVELIMDEVQASSLATAIEEALLEVRGKSD